MLSNQQRIEMFRDVLNASREKQTENFSSKSSFSHHSTIHAGIITGASITKCEGTIGNAEEENEEESEDESGEEGSEDLDVFCKESNGKNYCKGKQRPSDEFLRNFALQRPVISLFQNFKCPSTCSLGGNCKNSVAAVAITEELNSFWGEASTACSTTYRRKAIISKLLASYHRDDKQSYFAFNIGSSIGQGRRVCENTYLEIIGISKKNMWLKAKVKVIQLLNSGLYDQLSSKSGFEDVVLKAIQQTKHYSETKSRKMSEQCEQFIQRFGQVNGSKSPFPGEENLTVLPVETVAQFYTEYWLQCTKECNSRRKPASKETFRKTYYRLKKEGLYKFTRGKGTFPTCDICNNANDLLANSKSNNMTASVRDLIMDLKVFEFTIVILYSRRIMCITDTPS